jgi:hypothetical protein
MLKAYVAPHGEDEPFLYSVFVDHPDGSYELSPEFGSPSEAIVWALERTDFVIARESTGPYYWYGRGRIPSDIESPPK